MRQRRSEAEVIREVSGRILGGESVTSVCRDLNRRQVLTPGKRAKDEHGRPVDGKIVGQSTWTTPRLRKMLSSPRHAAIVWDASTDSEAVDERGQPVKAQWSPILPRDEWEQLRAVLAGRSFKNEGWSNRRSHLLTGMVRCGVCGARAMLTRGRNQVWSYRCRGHVSRARDLVDAHVLRAVMAYALEHPLQIDDIRTEDQDDVQKEIAREEAKLRDLEDAFVSQTSGSATVFARTSARIETRIEQLRRAQLAKLERLTHMQWAQLDLTAALESSASLMPKDDTGAKVNAIEAQRHLIALYVDRIVIRPVAAGLPHDEHGRRYDEAGTEIAWLDPNRLFWRAVVSAPTERID